MAKRCLVVTYYFPPTGGGGVQRIAKLIKYMSRDDWQFTVLTSAGSSNLPIDDQLLHEIPVSCEVHRIPDEGGNAAFSGLFKSTFVLRWISSLFFIPDRHKKWTLLAKKFIVEQQKKDRFDIVLISSPPYSLAILATQLTAILPVPVVLDMRDPWTTNPYKIYPTRWHYHWDLRVEMLSMQKIKYGVSAYNSHIEYYKKHISGFDSGNWRHISNGFDEEDFKALKPLKTDNSKMNIAFSGTFYSHINNPIVLFEALAGLAESQKQKIVFHHIGSTNISLSQIAKKYNLSSHIMEWGYHSHRECLNILAGMDVLCFILDSKHPAAGQTIGGKVYEYLRLSKPVLALVPEGGEAADLIRQTGVGAAIDPYNTEAIKKILLQWLEELPRPADRQIYLKYERSELAKCYGQFFDGILEKQ